MKNHYVAVFLILLITLSLVGVQLVSLGKANPYNWMGTVSPDADTKPPSITILSPENNKTYNTNITLSLNVTVGESKTASYIGIDTVYYKPDWENKNITLSSPDGFRDLVGTHSFNVSLIGVPEGNHSITIYAIEAGDYGDYIIYNFCIDNSATVNFTVDSSNPTILVLSPINQDYHQSNIPLSLTIDEQGSKIIYSLDGKENASIVGNTTLTGLANGNHNLTIYAKDEAGNIGVSETIGFSVDVPFPIMPITASIAIVVIVVASLLIYFKKHKFNKTSQYNLSRSLNQFKLNIKRIP